MFGEIDEFYYTLSYAIYNRIRYLISIKSGVTYIFSHNHAKISFFWF